MAVYYVADELYFVLRAKSKGMDVLVHRGIYEAAKGMYNQLFQEVVDYQRVHGGRARFRFTGHSLGGSLSLLVSLMLVAREVVPASSMLPVVTFGAPFIFGAGQRVLQALGLNDSFVQSVMMHRDIVPRAFSCRYPDRVAVLLRRLSASFQHHPCLNNDVSNDVTFHSSEFFFQFPSLKDLFDKKNILWYSTTW